MKSRIDWHVEIPYGGRADLSALTLAEWDELQWQTWRAEAAAIHAAAGPQEPPAWSQRAPAMARDRYGWRGLRGTSYLGPALGWHDGE